MRHTHKFSELPHWWQCTSSSGCFVQGPGRLFTHDHTFSLLTLRALDRGGKRVLFYWWVNSFEKQTS